MEAISSVDEGAISDTRSNVSRIPVRKLALATALTCIVAQAVSQMGGDLGGHARNGPLGVVLGQTIWNAAQVGLLLLLLCLWRVDRHWGSIALTIGALVCLPFGIYALSPGGWLLTGLLLVTCVLTWVRNAPDLGVTIVEAPARGVATIAKFEFIAFLCNFLSTLYNYSVTRRIWPYWSNIYSQVSSLTGFTPNLATIDRVMYTLGIPGVEVPVYIKTGNDPNSVGAALFLLIWTVLPTLYILYLAALAKLAKGTPLAKLQQALCAVGIFHFLFLTDIVDYRFGRGIINAAEHPAHIIERFAFGVAIALPIHQKLFTRQWLRDGSLLGIVAHYALAAWTVGFVIYHVVIYLLPQLFFAATGERVEPIWLFTSAYRFQVGYFGALVLMALLFGFATVALRCKRISAFALR